MEKKERVASVGQRGEGGREEAVEGIKKKNMNGGICAGCREKNSIWIPPLLFFLAGVMCFFKPASPHR